MKVLVFGASGFIGRHLVKKLLENNHQVTGVSKNKNDEKINSPKYSHILLDITKKEEFEKLDKDFDCVFNVSAYIPFGSSSSEEKSCFMVNCVGLSNILRFVLNAKFPLFVHSSSASVYGHPKIIPVEENDELLPDNVYGISKLAGEQLCSMYARLYKLNIVVLRYPSVYGKCCKQNTVLPIFVKKALSNENIVIDGKGLRSQDCVYVEDIVLANLLAAQKKKTGVFNIGSNKTTTMVKLALEIVKITGSRSKIIFNKSVKESDFHMLLDISRAKRELDYKSHFDLESGLKEYLKSL